MTYNLHGFQNEGARWLATRRRGLLGDGPRVGKSPQAIVACDLVNASSILVVCPGIARENWAREIQKVSLFGRPVAVLMGKDDPIEPNGWTIVSMDGSRNDALHQRVMAHRWDVLIVDEQQFLSNGGSQRTRQVLSARGFAASAGRIWFLTGTPMLNQPDELWVILRTIGVFMGDLDDFRERFCEGYVGPYGYKVTAYKNLDELRAMLARVMLRRTFYQMFPDAPRPTWREAALNPTFTDQADVVALADLENHPRYGRQVVSALSRVAAGEQIDWAEAIPQANFAQLRRLTSAAKTKPLAHWLRSKMRGSDAKIVVFAHHSGMLKHLEADLADFGARAIMGATKDRQARIDAFTNDPARRLLICQDQIARTAIDLSVAHHLVFGEMDPVPANNLQAAMRVQGHRQTRPVTLWATGLPCSTDAAITKINVRKAKLEEELFG